MRSFFPLDLMNTKAPAQIQDGRQLKGAFEHSAKPGNRELPLDRFDIRYKVLGCRT